MKVLSGNRLKNNTHSPALNMSFAWYSLRSDGSIPVFLFNYTSGFPAHGPAHFLN
jgi:hypothetical protein